MNDIRKIDGFKNQYLFVLPAEWMDHVRRHELFRNLLVTDIGYFPNARHHYRERAAGIGATILLYCREGRGSLTLGNSGPIPLESGQAALIPPNTPHRYSADPDQPWSVYWAHFSGDAVAGQLRLIGETAPLGVPTAFDGDILREFHRCFELLKLPYQIEEYLLVCRSVGSILALMACAAKQHKNQLTAKGGLAIERCIRFMKTNISRPLTLQQLAEASGYSASHLSTLFKRSTSHAPMDYFLRMKMQAASKDLYFSARPIKDIAIDYGIKDPYYFSRLYKKTMGLSPTDYRNQPIG